MFRTISVHSDDYAGFLSFLSEELLDKENTEIEGFHIFRYQLPNEKEIERVQLEIRTKEKSFEEKFDKRLLALKNAGIIKDFEENGWRLEKRIFGNQGSELATKIMDLSTEFAIKSREKFGKLIDPQNEFPEETMERGMSPGLWLLFSTLTNAMGYDSIQEINAYITAIQTRLQFMNQEESEKVKRIMRLMFEML